MPDLLRQEIIANADVVVVKVGTRVVTCRDGTLNEQRIAQLAEEVSQIIEHGHRVVLVSSGAVGAGISTLGLSARPTDVAQLQAVAAVGQTKLIEAYDRTFREFGRHAAQVLLTADDLDDRARYLNVRNTLLMLLDFRAVPIINENDTVAVDELMATFGDNDRLAALVTNLLPPALLIILSDVDGLFAGDPRDPQSQLIQTITRLDTSIYSHVRKHSGGVSKGGMASKLEAARMVATAGENAVIANGHKPGVLARILHGEVEGTLVVAQGKVVSPRKRWIGYSAQSGGKILLDAGAQRAVTQEGRSLLAIGVVAVEQSFGKGDVVSLCDAKGNELARGLTNYAAEDLQRIKGCKSDRIAEVLGHRPYEEVVHRNNLMIL